MFLFFFSIIVTIVGTKPTRFPARRCLRDQARISAAVVMISGVEGEADVDIVFFAFFFFSFSPSIDSGARFIFSVRRVFLRQKRIRSPQSPSSWRLSLKRKSTRWTFTAPQATTTRASAASEWLKASKLAFVAAAVAILPFANGATSFQPSLSLSLSLTHAPSLSLSLFPWQFYLSCIHIVPSTMLPTRAMLNSSAPCSPRPRREQLMRTLTRAPPTRMPTALIWTSATTKVVLPCTSLCFEVSKDKISILLAVTFRSLLEDQKG